MRLARLSLRNFKGVRDFCLDANGESVSIFGDNATGKTSISDAFSYLLFDKDSAGRSTFDIKTLDASGRPLRGLEHEVAAVLDLEPGQLELRKVYREIWSKKRGSAQAEFTGHESVFWVDGVPLKKADYQAHVASIADEAVFRLLTDPAAFNALHWQERRKALLAVSGDVTDADVIASDPALAALPGILGKRKLDDHKKVIAAGRAEINKALQALPVRIDEATRSLPEASRYSRATLESQLAANRLKRQGHEEARVRVQAGGQVVDQNRLVRQLLAETQTGSDEVVRLQRRMEALRNEWRQIDAREFLLTQAEECPACGQALPVEELREARERALGEFNATKSGRLEEINAEGAGLKARVAELHQADAGREAALVETRETLATLEPQATEIQARIDQAHSAIPDASQDPDYQRLQAEKARVQQEIEALGNGNAETLQRIASALRVCDEETARLEGAIQQIEQRERGQARIEELGEQERKLAAEYERLEQELYLCDQFTRAKVAMLTDGINSRFKLARFKLFDQQVNGGLAECCETLCNGVPFSTALNQGARVQVGLDIVRTLQQHYGFHPPCWVDGCESVTWLPEMPCQMIRLVVSKPDKTLRVELEPAVKEAIA